MKKIISLALLFVSISVFSQDEILPASLDKAFKDKYPSSKIADWSFDNDLYNLNYNIKSSSYTATFDDAGNWIETSEIISDFDIPSPLQDYITTNYPDGTIDYCERVEANTSLKFIRVNVFNNETLIVLQSELNGNKIKIVKEEAE